MGKLWNPRLSARRSLLTLRDAILKLLDELGHLLDRLTERRHKLNLLYQFSLHLLTLRSLECVASARL